MKLFRTFQKFQQHVVFSDRVETHEFEHSVDEELPLNMVDDFVQTPIDPPKLGYSLGIHSAANLGVYDIVEV